MFNNTKAVNVSIVATSTQVQPSGTTCFLLKFFTAQRSTTHKMLYGHTVLGLTILYFVVS